MSAVQTKSIKLHKAQKSFRQSDAIYRGFVGGIGSGKSWAGAYDLIRRAKPGRLYLAGAPTYPMMRDATLRTFKAVATDLGFLKDFAKGDMMATLGNGAEVLFRSTDDPERLRGPNLSGIWLDEASLMTRDVYTILIGRLREEGEQGWLSATFTPKGLAHWTYEIFGQPRARTELFHAQTRDNPFLPQGFHETLAAQYGDVMSQQELEGLFVDDDDAWQVIPTSWIRAAQGRWTDKQPEGQKQVCVGVDVARGGADATVIAARYGQWFAKLKKYRGPVTDDGEKAAKLVMLEWEAGAAIHVDAIGLGASCYDFLKRRVEVGRLARAINVAESSEEWDKTHKYKLTNIRTAMFWRLREALDPERGDNLALPPDNELLTDLSAPRFDVRASGIVVEPKDKIKERLGRSPDCGDAVALAHYQVKKYKLDVYL